jgi:hypothetical protein
MAQDDELTPLLSATSRDQVAEGASLQQGSFPSVQL